MSARVCASLHKNDAFGFPVGQERFVIHGLKPGKFQLAHPAKLIYIPSQYSSIIHKFLLSKCLTRLVSIFAIQTGIRRVMMRANAILRGAGLTVAALCLSLSGSAARALAQDVGVDVGGGVFRAKNPKTEKKTTGETKYRNLVGHQDHRSTRVRPSAVSESDRRFARQRERGSRCEAIRRS